MSKEPHLRENTTYYILTLILGPGQQVVNVLTPPDTLLSSVVTRPGHEKCDLSRYIPA